MFRKPVNFFYIAFGISIGITISILSNTINSITWPRIITYVDRSSVLRKDMHMHDTHRDPDESERNHEDMHADEEHHHDDDTVARDLFKKVRILCWVLTNPKNLNTKAIHVKHTWGKRCNVLLFMSSTTDKAFPTIGLNISEGRQHLTAKTMNAFRYIYDHHFHEADWFLKADDDTYVIVENLRYFLSEKDSGSPVYFGHHFRVIVKGGYHSGGAGYVLSKEALRRFAELGRDPRVCRKDGGAEDAEMGACLQKLNVTAGRTVDNLGRSRFHCFNPGTHVHGGYPKWFYQYDSSGAKKGLHNISDYAITFHYVSPQEMHSLEFYVYHLRPFGISSGSQNLNIKDNH